MTDSNSIRSRCIDLFLAVFLTACSQILFAGMQTLTGDWTDVGRVRPDDVPLFLSLAGLLFLSMRFNSRRSHVAGWVAVMLILVTCVIRTFIHTRSLL
jgi:hypothetical protein